MKKECNTFYVSVEGNCEKFYLERLRELINTGNYKFKVQFRIQVNKPTSFIKATFKGFSEFPYFHICDYEGNSEEDNTKFNNIIDNVNEAKEIKKWDYILCYTNLCFELWLILHKTLYTKPTSNKKDYKNEITKLFNINCTSWSDLKKEENIKKILKEISISDVKTAIYNAKLLDKQNSQRYNIHEYNKMKFYKENPSLNLHEFVEFVLIKSGEINSNDVK